MKNTYWLSFVKDKVLLGVCIVDADSKVSALLKTWRLAINPGGESLIYNMNDMYKGLEEANRMGRDRLITKKELLSKNYKSLNDVSKQEAERVHSLGEVIHEHCNEELKDN